MAQANNETEEHQILTQKKLQERLRDRGLPLSTSTIHACMDAGMPRVNIVGNKKPRFHWDQCWAWIIATRDEDPLRQATRDALYLRMRGSR